MLIDVTTNHQTNQSVNQKLVRVVPISRWLAWQKQKSTKYGERWGHCC